MPRARPTPNHQPLPTSTHSSPRSLPPSLPNPTLSPDVQKLRKDYRWAMISQFLWMFAGAAGIRVWDIDAYEADLDSLEADTLIPDTIVKLLYTLTFDRTINRTNLEAKLRAEYIARAPRDNPFGDEGEPRGWDWLGLDQKVDALHKVCEWQFSNPAKFRALFSEKEDPLNWRVVPCGWDKDDNIYWLFDDNRLWVQHPPPPPPKPERPLKASARKSKAAKGKGAKSTPNGKKGKPAPIKVTSATPTTSGRGSSSRRGGAVAEDKGNGKGKGRAKDEQDEEEDEADEEDEDEEEILELPPSARKGKGKIVSPSVAVIEQLLAEERGLRSTRKRSGTAAGVNAETGTPSKRTRSRLGPVGGGEGSPSASTTTPAKQLAGASSARGSRSTRRNRAASEDVWQEVPEEWLSPSGKKRGVAASVTANGKGKQKEVKKPVMLGLDDDDSELSSLTDEEEEEEKGGVREVVEGNDAPAEDDADEDEEVVPVDESIEAGGEAAETEAPADTEDSAADMVVDAPESHPPAITDEAASAVKAVESEEQQDVNAVAAEAGVAEQAGSPGDAGSGELAEADQMDVDVPAESAEDAKTENGGAAAGAGAEESVAPVPASECVAASEGELESKVNGNGATTIATGENAVLQEETLDEAELPKPEPVAPVKTALQLKIEVAVQKVEEEEDTEDEVYLAAKKAKDPGFVEWECVCATRWDWENWPERFKGSRDANEKAFYSHINDNVRPEILLVYRDKEIQWAKDEAIRNRKRSSRIAMKELEREEAQKAEEARRELETRMQKVRDEEERVAQIQDEKLEREREREDRIKEREERIKLREEAAMQKALDESKAREEAEKAREIRLQRRLLGESQPPSERSTTPQSTRAVSIAQKRKRSPEPESEAPAPEEESWELACEICKEHGWNMDDGRNICCCENCGRWQHTDCHDRHDDLYGKPRRNWDKDDFYCADCKKRLARGKPGRKPKNPEDISPAKSVAKKSPKKADSATPAKPKKRKIEKPQVQEDGDAPISPKIKFTIRNDRPAGSHGFSPSHLSPPGAQPQPAQRSYSDRSNGSYGGPSPNGQHLHFSPPQQQYQPRYPAQLPIAGPSQPHQSFQHHYAHPGQQQPLTQAPLDNRRLSGSHPMPVGYSLPQDPRDAGRYIGHPGQLQGQPQPRLPPPSHNLPARPNVPFPPHQQSQPSPVSRAMQVSPNGQTAPTGLPHPHPHDQRRLSHGSYPPRPPSHFPAPMPYAQQPPPPQNGMHVPMSAVPAGYVQSYSFHGRPAPPQAPPPHHLPPGQGGSFQPGPSHMPHAGQQVPARPSMSTPINGYMQPR